jgi:hypothetical protein
MSTGSRNWLVPVVAALAVLAVVAALWSQRPGSSGEDAGVAGGGDAGQGSPPYAGTEPGSPGVEPPPDGGSAGPDVPDADAGTIAVDSFYRYDATHLALNYVNGVPECYGDAGTPLVEETADAVVVTIPRIPPKSSGDTACIDIALLGSVDVTLSAPLDGRVVLDGAREKIEVKDAAAPNEADQAK